MNIFFSPDGGKTVLISTSSLEIPGPVLKFDTKPFVYPSAPTNQKYTLVDCKHNYRFVRFEQHRRVDEAPHTIYCCTICNHLILKATNSKDTNNSANNVNNTTATSSASVVTPQGSNHQENQQSHQQLFANATSAGSLEPELIDNSSIGGKNTLVPATATATSSGIRRDYTNTYNQLRSYDEDIDDDDDDDDDRHEDDYDIDD